MRKSHRSPSSALLQQVRAYTQTLSFKHYLQKLLVELCRIDTTPNADVGKMRAAEDACLRILQRELMELGRGPNLQRVPLNPAIQNNPHFSLLHFTKTTERPNGLAAEEAYAGRSNLVCVLPGLASGKGQSLALNAHIDVVAPWFPPKVREGIVRGRGACDDKGPVVAIIAALKAISACLKKREINLNRNVVAMFVVEEETGGNGSLSLALDRELKKLYDSILVCACTGLKIHPANRGAVWYRARLKPPPEISGLELAAFVIEELEKEGAAIRAESRHPLFRQRPVQTCHGIIGSFGEHPSRICGEVQFRILTNTAPTPRLEQLVRDCLDSGLADYIGLYGDKTQVKDPATGKPVVARHYDLRRTRNGFEVDVHGATGHMGAIRERDGAITKTAHLVRSLVYSRARLESVAGGSVRFDLAGVQPAELLLEGGQGFVPTHGIDEVIHRLRSAAERGAINCLLRRADFSPQQYTRAAVAGDSSRSAVGGWVTVAYEKLHNIAFDGDPDSRSMRNAMASAQACGIWKDDPVLGWTVSCDARLFASEYPKMDVLTFGPGQLAFAHSDHEQISIEEIRAAAEFLAVFILLQTGTLSKR